MKSLQARCFLPTGLLALGVLLLPSHLAVASQECPAVVFLGNGINTTKGEAVAQMMVLRNYLLGELQNSPAGEQLDIACFRNAIASPGAHVLGIPVGDLLESFAQIVNDKTAAFFDAIDSKVQGRTAAEKRHAGWYLTTQLISDFKHNSGKQLAAQVEEYRRVIHEEQSRVVIVAHSQGVLFANAAYTVLTTGADGSAPVSKDWVSVVAVAPPDSVASREQWTTFYGDIILGVPTSPIPNTRVAGSLCNANWEFIDWLTWLPNLDVFGLAMDCHNFASSYLAGIHSKPRILEQILKAVPSPPHIDTVVTVPVQPVAAQAFTFTVQGHLSNIDAQAVQVLFSGPGCTPCVVPNDVLVVHLPVIQGPATLNNAGTYKVSIRNGINGMPSNQVELLVSLPETPPPPPPPNQPPTAGFSMSVPGQLVVSPGTLDVIADPVTRESRVTFTDASSDPNGASDIKSRVWSVNTQSEPLSGEVTEFTWGFRPGGPYIVTLTVTDRVGTSSTATATIFVEEGSVLPTWSALPNTGALVDEGATDSYFSLLSGPTCPSGNCPVMAAVSDGFPIGQGWPANTGVSKWIVPTDAAANTHPPGMYVYRLSFIVRAEELPRATVSGRTNEDDVLEDIRINESSSVFRHHPGYFTVSSGFKEGVNTLDFVVANLDCQGCNSTNPTGLRVEFRPSPTLPVGGQLLVSEDAGLTWQPRQIDQPNVQVQALAIGTGSGTVYAGTNRGVYRSIDRGNTWQAGSGVSGPITAVASAPGDNAIVYAIGPGTVYRSVDLGTSWVEVSNLFVWFFHRIAVSPHDERMVFILGSDGLRRSWDGGLTWQEVPIFEGRPVTSVAFHRSHLSTFYVGTRHDGGFKTADDGVSWAGSLAGLATAVGPSDGTMYSIVAAPPSAFAGVWRTPESGVGSMRVNNGFDDPVHGVFDVSEARLAINPTDSNVVYATFDDSFGRNSRLHKTIGGGAHWDRLSLTSTTRLDIYDLLVDPQEPSRIYIAANVTATNLAPAASFRMSFGAAQSVSNVETLRVRVDEGGEARVVFEDTSVDPDSTDQNQIVQTWTTDPGNTVLARHRRSFSHVFRVGRHKITLKSEDFGGAYTLANGIVEVVEEPPGPEYTKDLLFQVEDVSSTLGPPLVTSGGDVVVCQTRYVLHAAPDYYLPDSVSIVSFSPEGVPKWSQSPPLVKPDSQGDIDPLEPFGITACEQSALASGNGGSVYYLHEGGVFAYDSQGTPLPGWPYTTYRADLNYAFIGADPPYRTPVSADGTLFVKPVGGSSPGTPSDAGPEALLAVSQNGSELWRFDDFGQTAERQLHSDHQAVLGPGGEVYLGWSLTDRSNEYPRLAKLDHRTGVVQCFAHGQFRTDYNLVGNAQTVATVGRRDVSQPRDNLVIFVGPDCSLEVVDLGQLAVEILTLSGDVVIAQAHGTDSKGTVTERGVIAIQRGHGVLWHNENLPFDVFDFDLVEANATTVYFVGASYFGSTRLATPRLWALNAHSGEPVKSAGLGAVMVVGLTLGGDGTVYLTVSDDDRPYGQLLGTKLLKIQ